MAQPSDFPEVAAQPEPSTAEELDCAVERAVAGKAIANAEADYRQKRGLSGAETDDVDLSKAKKRRRKVKSSTKSTG